MAVLLNCGCGHKVQPKSTPDTISVSSIQLGGVIPATTDRLQYDGTIQADKTINLSFQVSGTITSIPVQTGDYVLKGQKVAEIDETVYRNQYNAQQAQAKLAEENYNRTLEVFKKGSIAEIKMLQARADFDQATSAAKASYQNIVHTKLFAPVNGYIGDKKIEAGATASPGTPVVQLLDIRSVQVLVAIPESEINRYKVGNTAAVTVDALGGEPLLGKVSEIGVLAQQNSASYNVKVHLINPVKALKPGMLCKITFTPDNHIASTDSASHQEIIVPAQAVQVDEKGNNFVFVADEAGKKAFRRQVQTGALYSSGIAIKSGLVGSERLITSGYQKLNDSTPIILNK
ncbi:RND family efflux transporter, MFP subunit [Chitinophaga costaii]|uniref:RND family efflux transporter, MFP subunit n=2 Tax=Chitinophaga costaii TaxID=1335309 RepID=A0A1C4F213_9BACT|nr:RND family efflux transporter, MFP subunit [Chitinophaga costaii]